MDEPPPDEPAWERAPAAAPSSGRLPDRDTRIMRQAVLNTATSILGSGGRAVSEEDVIELAARLEAWVLRGLAITTAHVEGPGAGRRRAQDQR